MTARLRSRNWRLWAQASVVRAVRTAAQAALALVGTDMAGIIDVDWAGLASGSALAAFISVLSSLTGLPEVPDPDR